MSQDSQQRRPHSPFYTQLEVTAAGHPTAQQLAQDRHQEQTDLLRDILSSQDRTNELLEELLAVTAGAQKQRASELNQWKQANAPLARTCREAAEGLSRVQVEFLRKMTDEINDSADGLMDGEFLLSEFVDRFGPRLAHLNGIIQVLAQLGTMSSPTDTTP